MTVQLTSTIWPIPFGPYGMSSVNKKFKILISVSEPDMNEFSFVAEEIAETFMKAKDAHLLMAQDCFQNYTKPVHLSNRL